MTEPVFSHTPPAAPTKPRFGHCPICGRPCALKPNGTVGSHLVLLMGRDGPYNSDKWCRGFGGKPESDAAEAVR